LWKKWTGTSATKYTRKADQGALVPVNDILIK
jgi:hypothetical protein